MSKVKKIFKAISLVLATALIALVPVGCNGNGGSESGSSGGNPKLPAFDREKYFYGGAELASEVGPKGDWRDEGVTMEWTSKTAGALGVNCQRVWMHLNTVIQRAETSNEMSLIQAECDRYHEYFARLKAEGVERILVMNHRYIYPYGYKAGTTATVPEPMKDPEIYKTWLEMYSECYRMLATEFPEIDFWECGNEFDLDSFMHKSDYNNDKMNSLYPQGEAAAITADLCYAAKKGVTSVDEYNFIVMPGMSQYAQEVYFEGIYNAIESKKYPTIETHAVTDPDEYFDIIAWHCYPLNAKASGGDHENGMKLFEERGIALYDVAKRHNDGEKRVWITEIGITEASMGEVGTAETQALTAEYAMRMLDIVEEKMPFVETCFWFRYSNCYSMNVSEGENNFGLFYSPDDLVNRGKPKPAAIALYKRINGEDADISPLYWYSDKYGVER